MAASGGRPVERLRMSGIEPMTPSRKKIRRLLRDCEIRLAELNVPEPCDMAGLTRYLSQQRNRLIHLIPTAMDAAHPSGIWLALQAVDVVIYEANTSRTH